MALASRRSALSAGFLAALFGLLAAGARGDRLAPEILNAGDAAWEDLYLLELSGAMPAGISSMRPIPRGEAARWIAGASRAGPVASAASEIPFARLDRRFSRELRRLGERPRHRETPPAILLAERPHPQNSLALDGASSELRLGGAFSLHGRSRDGLQTIGDSTRAGIYGVFLLGRTVALQGEIFVGKIREGRSFGDPLVAGTDILYFLDEASAAVAADGFWARLARGRHRWGPGWGSALLLDGASAPINFLEYDLSLPAGIRFRSFSGSLNVAEERGIAAHRLEVPLGPDLRVAIFEGVRFYGGFDHPLYLLGLLPYTLVQRLDWQDSAVDSLRMRQRNNVLAGADVCWRPAARSLAYAELLVDDLPAASGKAPARVGFRIGVAFMPSVGGAPIDVGLEAAKISRYAYGVYYGHDGDLGWIHQGRGIGERDGPDQEAIRLRLGRYAGRDLRIEIGLLYANRGAGDLGEAWSESLAAVTSPTRRALTVSGPVERERGASLRWSWDPRDNVSVSLLTRGSLVRHPGNRPGGGRAKTIGFSLLASIRL